jgi:hypothetical protein
MTPSPTSPLQRPVARNGAPATGAEASAALVLRYFEMWNSGQGALADEVLGPTYLEHAHPNFLGPAASRSLVPRLHGLYPGMVVSAEIVLASAEYVVVRTTVEPGEIDGHPDGPRRGMAMFRIVGGKLVEQWSWYAPAER